MKMNTVKKLSVAMLAAGFVCLGIPASHAAVTDSITITVTLAEIVSVNVDVATWAIGAKALSDTALSDLVTATNDGNVTEDLLIKATDADGAWTLGAAAGADQFALGLDISDPYETFVAIDKTGVSLKAALVRNAAQTFKMQYSLPTSDTKGGGVAQGFTVTVTASKTP